MFSRATLWVPNRTLWFTWDPPKVDRKEVEKYLYGWDGTEKQIIDVNCHDGDEFFHQLNWYFETHDPHARLSNLKALAESYRSALLENFALEDLLADIGSVRKHYSWTE
jgi:hypothetical protein